MKKLAQVAHYERYCEETPAQTIEILRRNSGPRRRKLMGAYLMKRIGESLVNAAVDARRTAAHLTIYLTSCTFGD